MMKSTRFLLAFAVCATMLFAGCSEKDGEDQPKTYTVTVTSGDNGTAVADKATATEGATVKLTATPDPGCEFVKWTVESGGITLSATATATFTMPARDVKVKAEFVVRGLLINGTIWAFCNVDAPGTFAANPEDTGMYYQWNRKVGWSSTDDPMINSDGGTTWDDTDAEGDEWAAENDPCPEGWRVPTHEEQAALCDAEISEWTELNDVYGRWFTDEVSGNSVFFPAAGHRYYAGGALTSVGSDGYYWSASPTTGSSGYNLYLGSNGVTPAFSNFRAYGFSVRCVAK